MRKFSVSAVVALAVFTILPVSASGQIRASERASVSQTVDGTVISLDYSRPQAKGRSPIFGGPVKWDRSWTGANEATVLELNRDVTIQGRDVPAGRWSLWLVPSQQGTWEMFLDPRTDLWHTARPGPTEDQIRFPVEPAEGEHVEALTWSFPRVAPDGATMTLAWGTKRVPVEIEVEPFYERTVSSDRARPFVGSWELQWGLPFMPDEPVPFDISYTDDGELRVQTIYPTPEGGTMDAELLLLPKAEGVFQPAVMEGDKVVDTVAYIFLEFEYDGDRPTGFLIRWAADDSVMGEGQPAS